MHIRVHITYKVFAYSQLKLQFTNTTTVYSMFKQATIV